MAQDRIVTEISGVVTLVNGNGFRLDGRESWVNVSKWAPASVTLPEVGQHVAVGLDAAGYARAISAAAAPRPVAGEVAAVASPAPPDKDTQIRRMNALSTSVALLSSGGRIVEPGELLDVAALLEAWVCR